MSNVVKVLFFATLKQVVGREEIFLTLPDNMRVSDFKHELSVNYPALTDMMKSVIVAVNHEFASDVDYIPLDAEIAVFPPVSGGEGLQDLTFCTIVTNNLDLNKIVADVTLSTTGAVGLFVGVVRAITKRDIARTTEWLEYEAYEPMAISMMHRIAEEIRSKWVDIEAIAIVQRVGVVKPGIPTVAIACSAPHRDMGIFDAAHYGIDRLKEIIPVWKKEIGISGEEWIEGTYLPGEGE
jgi:molybdopterin synthase catalytic subunit